MKQIILLSKVAVPFKKKNRYVYYIMCAIAQLKFKLGELIEITNFPFVTSF